METLTPEELRLAEDVDTREWRARYQPQGVCFRNYPLPEPRWQAEVAGSRPGPLAGAGENACADSVGAKTV